MKILVAESTTEDLESAESIIISMGHSAETALNGKDAQFKIYETQPDLVILDWCLKDHSPISVLKYLKTKYPGIKVTMTLPNKEKLKEDDFSEAELKKLGVDSIYYKPYGQRTLQKSIEKSISQTAWQEILSHGANEKGVGETQEIEYSISDLQFTKVEIKNLFVPHVTFFDLYIRLGKDRYVKLFSKSQKVDVDRIKDYQQNKNVEYLHFKTSERGSYINFLNKALEKHAKSNKMGVEKKISSSKILVEQCIQEVWVRGIDKDNYKECLSISQNMYSMINADPNLGPMLLEFKDLKPQKGLSHIFLTALYTVAICNKLSWNTKRTIEIATMGALLHDIGVLQLPENLRQKSLNELESESEIREFMRHPEFGYRMMSNFALIKEPVRQIIYQHHELINGTGFPNAISGIKIFPIAKIVTFASYFSESCIANGFSPLEQLRLFIPDKEQTSCFDPEIIKSFVKVFINE